MGILSLMDFSSENVGKNHKHALGLWGKPTPFFFRLGFLFGGRLFLFRVWCKVLSDCVPSGLRLVITPTTN